MINGSEWLTSWVFVHLKTAGCKLKGFKWVELVLGVWNRSLVCHKRAVLHFKQNPPRFCALCAISRWASSTINRGDVCFCCGSAGWQVIGKSLFPKPQLQNTEYRICPAALSWPCQPWLDWGVHPEPLTGTRVLLFGSDLSPSGLQISPQDLLRQKDIYYTVLCRYAQMRAQTHVYTLSRTHADTHTHTHMDTHKHTHTHTPQKHMNTHTHKGKPAVIALLCGCNCV